MRWGAREAGLGGGAAVTVECAGSQDSGGSCVLRRYRAQGEIDEQGRLKRWCEGNGMKNRGGGGGSLFINLLGQLKGLLEAQEPLEDKFCYDCEI